MRRFVCLCIVGLTLPWFAQASSLGEAQAAFAELYKKELGTLSPCRNTSLIRKAVCSDVLRNEGNAPYILHHGKVTERVAVLVHGLSDSPFYMREIARIMHDNGYTVLVPLLPGHGLRNASEADDAMEDSELAERWQAHVAAVIDIATSLSDRVVLGGFSTGGALVVDHYLSSGDNTAALLLFSGALALSEEAEGMAGIWGIKWLARLIDGDYQSHGPNPYKYPSVAGFAGLELMDIIEDIRSQFDGDKRIEVPVFVAHSAADVTTPLSGVQNLLAHSNGNDTAFVIDESYDVCHADVVLNTLMLHDMDINKALLNQNEPCAIPEANPLFSQMTMMLQSFLDSAVNSQSTH